MRDETSNQAIVVSYPTRFLLPEVSMDDLPRLKLWGARFFVNQLATIWNLGIPTHYPTQYVFNSLLDAIFGQLISSRDALRKKIGNDLRTNQIRNMRRVVLLPVDEADAKNSWLERIRRLRNNGLHGAYINRSITLYIGEPDVTVPTSIRLREFPNGIMADIDLPEDLRLACDKMEELISKVESAIRVAIANREWNGEDFEAFWNTV